MGIILEVEQVGNCMATIKILDQAYAPLADVHVDVSQNSAGRVLLVVTDDIEARDSDEPTMTVPLLTQYGGNKDPLHDRDAMREHLHVTVEERNAILAGLSLLLDCQKRGALWVEKHAADRAAAILADSGQTLSVLDTVKLVDAINGTG